MNKQTTCLFFHKNHQQSEEDLTVSKNWCNRAYLTNTDDIVLDAEPVEKIKKGGVIICLHQPLMRINASAAESA